jgi:pimeloyl-ACP methyl ester carboxylesterase
MPTELTFDVWGLRLAARAWGPEDGRIVLGFHGWLDNAATWDRVAPLLVERAPEPLRILSFDLPGHGRSQHRSSDAWYSIHDAVLTVARLVREHFDREGVVLMGHSMGGAVSTLAAGVLGERIAALLLVEGLTPLTDSPERALPQARKGLESSLKYDVQDPRTYESIEEIKRRIAARPWQLTPAAVEALALRGSIVCDSGARFAHDPRLKADSFSRLTKGQVLSILGGVTCPGTIVIAADGLPYDGLRMKDYVDALPDLTRVTIPGRHHVHLDDPEPVAEHFAGYLASLG